MEIIIVPIPVIVMGWPPKDDLPPLLIPVELILFIVKKIPMHRIIIAAIRRRLAVAFEKLERYSLISA